VKDRTGIVVCPLLLSQECRYCFKLGHTVKFCQALKNGEPGEKSVRRIRDQVYDSRVLQKYEEKPETKEKSDYEFPPLSPNVTLRPHQMNWAKECVKRPLSAAKGVPNVMSWVKITSTILNPKETLPVLQPQPTINSWTTEDKKEKEKVAVPFISVQQYEKSLRFSAGLKNGTIKWSDVDSDDDDDEQYIYI
jgi:hypothetical protein